MGAFEPGRRADSLNLRDRLDAVVVDDDFLLKVLKILSDPLRFPPEFLTWMTDQSLRNLPSFDQMLGGKSFRVKSADTVLTSESTTSLAYGDLATVGPSLTGLPNGAYLIFFGTTMSVGGAGAAAMSVSLNGASAIDDNSLQSNTGTFVPGTRVIEASLSDAPNSIVAKYRSGGAGVNASFYHRWLLALKSENL